MRKLIALIAALASSSIAAAQQPAAAIDRLIGTWQGTLSVNGVRARLGLDLQRDSTGGLHGVFRSVDEGDAKLPATVRVGGDTITARIQGANASFTGVLAAGSDSIRGTFINPLNDTIPLVMGRATAPVAVVRPQDPKPPFPYRTEEVTIESKPGVRLAGTLSVPPGAGPFPAVVMVTGSGPQDRDEQLLGHRPFLVISDYLARHGIATLRYDDRGTAKSTGTFTAGTSVDFADDAEAAVRFLRDKAGVGIARDHIGVLGHSEGGLIAPMVAARSSDVAFIVLLAGPGIPGDSILLLQQGLVAKAMGTPDSTIAKTSVTNRRIFAAIKEARDSADAAARVKAVLNEMIAALPESERATAARMSTISQAQILSPWMRYFLPYDPRPVLRKVRVPVLAMNGTLDLQVPYKENLTAIDRALKEAGNRDYRTVEMAGLNHLFQPATTGSPAEYATISETVSPKALELIATWINAHGGGKK